MTSEEGEAKQLSLNRIIEISDALVTRSIIRGNNADSGLTCREALDLIYTYRGLLYDHERLAEAVRLLSEERWNKSSTGILTAVDLAIDALKQIEESEQT
jgi:hypothetical protein